MSPPPPQPFISLHVCWGCWRHSAALYSAPIESSPQSHSPGYYIYTVQQRGKPKATDTDFPTPKQHSCPLRTISEQRSSQLKIWGLLVSFWQSRLDDVVNAVLTRIQFPLDVGLQCAPGSRMEEDIFIRPSILFVRWLLSYHARIIQCIKWSNFPHEAHTAVYSV